MLAYSPNSDYMKTGLLFLLAAVLLCACQSCEQNEVPAPMAKCAPDFSPALNADGVAPNNAKITVYKADSAVVFTHNGIQTVVPQSAMPVEFFIQAGDKYRIETPSWADVRFEDCINI